MAQKLRLLFLAFVFAITSMTAVAAADNAPRASAGPATAQTCNLSADNGYIEFKSCVWEIYGRIRGYPALGGCAYGHFRYWNKYNSNQAVNTPDGSHCRNMEKIGKAFSAETCGTFFVNENGRWREWGYPICNNDN